MLPYTKLKSDRISLVPLSEPHIKELRGICADPIIWKWFSADLTQPDDMEKWMQQRHHESAKGEKMSYAVVQNSDQQIVGSSSYGHIDRTEKVIEIGWTWLGASFIGTGINKHMKYLMLSHAFQEMEMERVELRTDERNVRSRKAIEKIGATLDGILRSHRTTIGGRRRNTAIYSIIKPEWPDIRASIFKTF